MAQKSWEDRLSELLERIMAAAVVGIDPAPLKQELYKLIQETDEVPSASMDQLKQLAKELRKHGKL